MNEQGRRKVVLGGSKVVKRGLLLGNFSPEFSVLFLCYTIIPAASLFTQSCRLLHGRQRNAVPHIHTHKVFCLSSSKPTIEYILRERENSWLNTRHMRCCSRYGKILKDGRLEEEK